MVKLLISTFDQYKNGSTGKKANNFYSLNLYTDSKYN
jgi:hypothetical protein